MQSAFAAPQKFPITLDSALVSQPQTGRLFLVLSTNDSPEPRKTLDDAGVDAPFVLARDVTNFAPGNPAVLDQSAAAFPVASLAQIPPGDYFAQAVLEANPDLRFPNAPGNFYSETRKIKVDPAHGGATPLKLDRQLPPDELPKDNALIKYVKIQSQLLTAFYGRQIFLRAGIILPRDYDQSAARHYPLWVHIGGFASRYTSVAGMMGERSDFRRAWLAKDAPQMILLQLDGAGPLGDPYQVNSANHGPYGDAVTQELIPEVEKRFRAIGRPKARVLSGGSTGGWVSLALQVFYPDFFNGTWTFFPDGVDFRAFELVNIYEDDNAYVNKYGVEQPSERNVLGNIKLTMRREVGMENVLGAGNSWTMSGGQWGAWNATYGPRGADGKPVPLWDPQTGKIDHAVAEQWKKYDLRMVLQDNWKTLGPRLQGKLHISVGDADNYFLNNAVHLLDEFLSQADPQYKGRIVYGPGKGHGWMDITTAQMMKEMEAATGGASP